MHFALIQFWQNRMIYFRENSIVVTETVKRLNILPFAYRKDQNKRIYKRHLFVLRQVNRKELVFMVYLSYRL